MKKVGLVSCYFIRNYGSVLQAYALQRFLDQEKIDNETICVDGFIDEINKRRFRYFLANILNKHILKARIPMVWKRVLKKLKYKRLDIKLNLREEAIQGFANKIRLSEPASSFTELAEKSRKYHTILLGSDQLWHPSNIVGGYYTLEWVPVGINTVTYATSFGVSVLDKNSKKNISTFLPEIRNISVRESDGQRLVNELSGISAKLVCDPTMLFTHEIWDEIRTDEIHESESYIFCYLLGNSKVHRSAVLKLKEITGLKVMALPHIDSYIPLDERYTDRLLYDVSPMEFISLIANAEIVCTDSFHATIFSILYKKEFWAFHRFLGGTMSTNSRVEALAQNLGLEDRIIKDPSLFEGKRNKIDYLKTEEKLATIREESREFLLNSLQD